jgi:hypothetical protein
MAWAYIGSAAVGAIGGYLSSKNSSGAAQDSANAQVQAAQISANSAKFKPVGITTGSGSSNFQYDNNGNLVGAGYNLNPNQQGLYNSLQGMNQGNLQNYQNAGMLNGGLMQGSQAAMNLGQQYLGQSPQDVAAKYMSDQNKLLQPTNDRNLANLRTDVFNTGRSGLAVGGTADGSQGASNPEMQAYYNSLAQQQNQLASQATAAGQSNANFGMGLVNQGGAGMNSYYNNLSAAGQPLQNNLSMMQGIDAQGQQALSMGASLGSSQAAAGALSGGLYQKGVQAAQPYQYQANAYNPTATMLSGVGNALGQYQQNQQQQQNYQQYMNMLQSQYNVNNFGYPSSAGT